MGGKKKIIASQIYDLFFKWVDGGINNEEYNFSEGGKLDVQKMWF